MRLGYGELDTGEYCFNPRPTVRSGDAFDPACRSASIVCFNPRPTVRSGDALDNPARRLKLLVSIRARP